MAEGPKSVLGSGSPASTAAVQASVVAVAANGCSARSTEDYVRQMRSRRRFVLALGCLLLPVLGCSSPLASADPPTLTVQGAGEVIELRPWSYCWGSVCADGVPPRSLPSVGAGDRVRLSSSDTGLSLSAQFTSAQEECARVQRVPLGSMGQHLSLWPAGPAETYAVLIEVAGSQGHSASYGFRWTTTRDGVWPVPAASAAVLADDDGRITSYGVEVGVENLGMTPREASATVEVSSAEGRTSTIRPLRVEPDEGCEPAGSLAFRAPETAAHAVIASGSAPFRYEVRLVLDGRTYRGTATWPDDQQADAHPSVTLDFRPALPALPRR